MQSINWYYAIFYQEIDKASKYVIEGIQKKGRVYHTALNKAQSSRDRTAVSTASI